MRPGMRHPPPVPPLRPPQRLMPAPNDGGVFFGGRDYARRQQQPPLQQNYLPQKPLLPPGTPPNQWQNNPNYRPGPLPLIRPNGPWHPHGNTYHSPSPPPLLPPHHSQFNPNSQTPITFIPSNATTYELMRIANPDQIPFLEPHEDEDKLVRQHLSSNSNNDESLTINISPSKAHKRRRQQQQQQQQQHENNRNMISYQDLDRPDEQRDPSFDNRLVPKPNKTNHLPSDKTNNQIPIKSSTDKDHALKLELDRIKKAGAQEREKLKAQRQAAAEKEKEAQMKKNSAKTGDKEKREDGELGDSSDDENTKLTSPIEPKRFKKIVDNLALNPSKSTILFRSKTPPSESIIDMSVMKLIRPIKLFHLDDDNNNAYREYLTTNFGRVRVHCHKPQPNFFSNVSCIEEIKRRLRLNNNSSSSLLFRHLIDDNVQDYLTTLQIHVETEDGEIESDDENTIDLNGKLTKHMLSDDDNDKQIRKKTKLTDDGLKDITKSSLNEKPWITSELRQLIKQRNKLQAQILSGDTNVEIEKKFKKMRNKISKHAKALKAKYENSIFNSSEPSLAPPSTSQHQSTTSSSPSASTTAAAANHPLSTILDPALVMAMLVNPSLYSHVQQQVLSNPNFMQAYQHIFAEGNSTNSLPPKAASETQVVPSTTTTTVDGLIKQVTTTSKANKEQQQQNISSTRSRPVLTQATKPIQLSSLESDFDNEQRNKSKTRFTSSDTPLTESQQQDIALTQELIRRQLALTQQQRNQRNPHPTSQLSLSTPLSRHIPLTTEQMQEILTRAKNYVTRQQSDETTDSSNNQPRLSYNTRRLQAALAASASSATPQTAHTIGQAAAAAIAAVSARPSSSTATTTTTTITPTSASITIPKTMPSSSNSLVTPVTSIPPSSQQHPIRIQLDQKSKTLSSISNNQSLPIPTINQQKIMPLVDVNPSPPPHMYPAPSNWQRPPHLPVSHYPMPPHQQQYLPYDNPHTPPYYGPRTNYPPDIRPPPPPQSYGPLPPRHLSQPPRFNGPLPPPGPYGYGHPPQNYGPPPPHPHYACPPRSKPKIHPPRKTPDRITSRVFSICQSAVMNNHTAQRPVRLNNFKNHTALTSSKENVDNAYRTMIEFTETCKRESTNDGNPIEMPMPKRIRSSSPTSTFEPHSSPSAISRYISHDSYLKFIPPSSSSSDQCITTNNNANIDTDIIDEALWDDWDLPSTTSKKTPGKIRTMSSPAVHSRTKKMTDTTTILNELESTNAAQTSVESISLPPVTSTITWDDDDADFEQLLSQFPVELPSKNVLVDNDSILMTTPSIDDDNLTRLDETRRSSAILTTENQSLVHDATKIELSSQPNLNQNRLSNLTLQRANTGPLSSPIASKNTIKINSPRVRCDSASLDKKKTRCTEAEIEQKRLAALAIRRQREQEQQKQQKKR
ncbi:unnamed protein product [Rotaria sp. Silwood2]|nr:unnamed protein product [Rotaria sp. Silwood2]